MHQAQEHFFGPSQPMRPHLITGSGLALEMKRNMEAVSMPATVACRGAWVDRVASRLSRCPGPAHGRRRTCWCSLFTAQQAHPHLVFLNVLNEEVYRR